MHIRMIDSGALGAGWPMSAAAASDLESASATVLTWRGNTGEWTDASQWVQNIVPDGPNYAAEFGGSNAYTVSFGDTGSLTCAYAELDDPNATLSFDPACTLTTGGVFNNGTVNLQSLSGGALIYAGTLGNSGTVLLDTGLNSWNDVLYIDGNVTNTGAITLGNGATHFGYYADFAYFLGVTENEGVITSAGLTQLEGNTFDNSGSLVVSCSSSLEQNGEGASDNFTMVANSGTIALDGEVSFVFVNMDNTGFFGLGTEATLGTMNVTGFGTLANEGTIQLGGSAGNTLLLSFGNITNSGLIEVLPAAGQQIDFIFGTWTNTGTLIVGSGGPASQLSGQIYDQTSGETIVRDYLGANVDISGGLVQLSGGDILGRVEIGTGGTISGFGTISGYNILGDDGLFAVSGGTMVIDGQVSGTGLLTVAVGAVLGISDGGTFNGNAGVGGTLRAGGALTFGGVVLIGAGTIIDEAGAVIETGAVIAGNGTIAAPLTVGGVLLASDGVLTVDGAISGGGTLQANAGATLDLAGGGTFTGMVGGAGTLQLDGASALNFTETDVSVAAIVVDSGASLVASGIISSAVTDNGTLTASGGTLTLSGALSGTGQWDVAAGATLDLVAGGILNNAGVAGILSAGEALTFGGLVLIGAGAIIDAAGAVIETGAVIAGNGTIAAPLTVGGLLLASDGVLTVDAAISGGGTLQANAGATLDLIGGGTFTGTVGGAGTLQVDGASALNLAAAQLSVSAIVVDSGASLIASGIFAGTVTDNGTLTASGGTLTLSGAVSGTGILDAGAGATLDLSAGGTLGMSVTGAGTLVLGGAYTLGAGAVTVSHLLIDAGDSLSGAGTISAATVNNGTIAAEGGTLTIAAPVAGGTLAADAAATLVLAEGGSFGGTLAGAGAIDIVDPITLSVGAELAGANIQASARIHLAANTALLESAGATLSIDAATTKTIGIFGGSATSFTNEGSLVANGAGTTEISTAFLNSGNVSVTSGNLSFVGAVTNTGTINAAGGLLEIKKDVSGTGILEIGAAGTLSLLHGTAAGQTVDFLAGTGVLDLAHPIDFLGTIAGFGTNDVIDLIKTKETSFTYSNGVLTVKHYATTVAVMHFSGNFTQSDFSLSSDGHGGTFVKYV